MKNIVISGFSITIIADSSFEKYFEAQTIFLNSSPWGLFCAIDCTTKSLF
ncbi:hypothetical protein [Bombilactobacillus mellifer]